MRSNFSELFYLLGYMSFITFLATFIFFTIPEFGKICVASFIAAIVFTGLGSKLDKD